jgi:hypothetical protein
VGLSVVVNPKKSRGMRRTRKYAAMTREEGNAIDGSASEWKPLKELGEAERNLFQHPDKEFCFDTD